MPFHRIPRANADALVTAIEAAGEVLRFGWVEGDQYVLFTERLGTVTGTSFVPVDTVAAVSVAVAPVVPDTPL